MDVQNGFLSNKSTKKNKTSKEISFFQGLTQSSVSVARHVHVSQTICRDLGGKGGGCGEWQGLREEPSTFGATFRACLQGTQNKQAFDL